MFHIFSLYFLQVFFQFSPTFPNDKTELFPSSSVDGCLQEHWDWQDFLLQGMLPVQKFINRLHDFCVNRSCTCCGNISYDISCVCVCVSGWISQPYIVLCPVSKHKLAEMPQQDRFLWMTPLNSCKNNGWDGEDGAFFSCSSKASNSSTQTCAAHWNTKEAQSMKQTTGSTRSGLYGRTYP